MTATIEPRRDGTALLEVDGRPFPFASTAAAIAEARALDLFFTIGRFPPTSADVEVLAVAPALRVLA